MNDITFYTWVGLPLLIFSARIIDVSLGTLRIIFISRGQRRLAPLLGFVEVFIWIVVVSQITRQASNLAAYLGYAAGFAAGNYMGMWIEARLAIGTLVVRTILPQGGEQIAALLHAAGYGVTTVAGQGSNGPVQLLYAVIQRKDLAEVTGLIHQANAKAFLTVEEARTVQEGIFPYPPKGRQIAQDLHKGK
jgi:uncharacterized protein YebE (UPF0316 family)